MDPVLLVVGSGGWLGDELSTNTLGVQVKRTTGLFLPTHEPLSGPDGPSWWMPCAFATRLLYSGVEVTLTAPGPRWLTEIPAELTGRRIELRTVAEITSEISTTKNSSRNSGSTGAIRSGFSKLAEAKTDEFPAAWRTSEQLAADLARADLPPGSLLQITDTRLDLACEFRCYVLHGEVLSHSLYLRTDRHGVQFTYYDGALTTIDESDAALRFAREAATALGPAGQPAAYTLDVGFDRRSGRWLVIEGNPAWSSAWYGCDIDAVVATIVVSCRQQSADGDHFAYRPDEFYLDRAARQGPLR